MKGFIATFLFCFDAIIGAVFGMYLLGKYILPLLDQVSNNLLLWMNSLPIVVWWIIMAAVVALVFAIMSSFYD